MSFPLTDIYTQYLNDYEQLYFENFMNLISDSYLPRKFYETELGYYDALVLDYFYGTINGKYHLDIKHMDTPNIPDGYGYSGHFYWSPKYQRYQTVFLKIFHTHNHEFAWFNYYDQEYDYWNTINTYVFGRQTLYGLNNQYRKGMLPPLNPELLDVYYDTIGQASELKFFANVDEHDSMYFNKWGNDLLPLMTLPLESVLDDENTEKTTNSLYYRDTYKLNTEKYTVDKASDYPNIDMNVVEDSTAINYHFDQFFENKSNPITIAEHHFYKNINNIYNFFTDTNQTQTVKSYDFITMNDEYTIIAHDPENNKLNTSLSPYNLTNSDLIMEANANYGYKNINYIPSENINFLNVLGADVYYPMLELFTFAKTLDLKDYDTGLIDATEILNVAEYTAVMSVVTDVNALKLKTAIETSPNNALGDLILDCTNTPSTFNQIAFAVNNHVILSIQDNFSEFILNAEFFYDGFSQHDSICITTPSKFASICPLSAGEEFIIQMYTTDTYSLEHPTTDGYMHNKMLSDTTSLSPFEQFISRSELDMVPNYTRLNYFDFNLNTTGFLNGKMIDNSFLDTDRYKIYGVAINLSQSNSNYIQYCHNFSNLQSYVSAGHIVVEKFPVPILINQRDLNVATEIVIAHVNTEFEIDNISDIITDYTTIGINVSSYKSNILDYVLDSTSVLSSYDINAYYAYNKDSLKYDMHELQSFNSNSLSYVYMIQDTLTGEFDLINVNNFSDISSCHNNKIYTSGKYNKYYSFYMYEETPSDIDVSFSTYQEIHDSYNQPTRSVYLNQIAILNSGYIKGRIDRIYVTGSATTVAGSSLSVNHTFNYPEDFTTVGNDLILNLDVMTTSDYKLTGRIDTYVYLEEAYRVFSYVDSIILKFYTNFTDYVKNLSGTILMNHVGDGAGDDEELVTQTYMNIYDANFNNILPQILYSKELSLSMFDIDDNLLNFVPDNKKCLILQHYVGDNNLATLNFDDMTSTTDTTDLALFDKFAMSYNGYINQNKSLPTIVQPNVGKYLKVLMKLELDPASESLFDLFEYENVYNLSLIDATGAVLIMDGQINDLTGDLDFEQLLKEYRIKLNFTASHNVNNSITVPVFATLKYETFDTYNDYLTDTSSHVYDFREETILLDIKNRGDYIEVESELFPKLLDYIEYYDIYPQYELQTEILHTKEIEFSLTSADTTIVKVSELFFDVFFITDDTYIGIPIDYEFNPDPENEIVNINLTKDKDDILKYVNWLIRFKCPNCGDMHYKLQVKIKPNYFGFNIVGFTIGCYSHNVKIELFIPYIFYKASADTILIIDKKTVIEKEKKLLDDLVKSSFLNMQSTQTIDLFEKVTGMDSTALVNYVDRPSLTKLSYILFNSSFNSKEVIFNLVDNPTPKTIDNTSITFSLIPLELRLVSLEENILVEDYTNSFDSGLAIYDVIEHDLITDTTNIIDVAQLAIPSMDDYLRNQMNFCDKTAKIISTDFEMAKFVSSFGDQEVSYRDRQSLSTTTITKSNSSIVTVENKVNLTDIDYRFYIDETYFVTVDRVKLGDIATLIEPLGDVIYIKIPILSKDVDRNVQPIIKDVDNYTPPLDSTIDMAINNFYDNSIDYLLLVGKQTNIDQWTFNMKANFVIQNDTILNDILFGSGDHDLSKFTKYGLRVNYPMVNPQGLLSLLFLDFGNELGNYIVDNFVGEATFSSNPFEIITGILDSIPTNPKRSKPNLMKGVSFIGTSSTHEVINVAYEKISKVESTAGVLSTNSRLNNVYVNGLFEGPPPETECEYSAAIFQLEESYTEFKDNPIEQLDSYEDLIFDDVYAIFNEDNILDKTFNGGSGIFKINFDAILASGIPTKHYVAVKCDNNFDNIISARVQSVSKETGTIASQYEFLYKGDTNISFSSEAINQISVDLHNLNFRTLAIIIDKSKWEFGNYPYSLLLSMQKKILTEPLMIKSVDFEKNPILLIADTNYKMLFELPIEMFKATDSYITIDKIRIADNFINQTDYCVTFGDLNEQYNIRGNESKILGKTFYKYDNRNLKCIVRGFNIANQTGEYYTSIILYYTFNGENKTLIKDIKYRIELPNVLDNEYLIADVVRLDYSKAPIFMETDMSGETTEFKFGTNVLGKDILTNLSKGSYGCDLSYPDLNWYTSNNNDGE